VNESQLARSTHELSHAEGGTCQDSEICQPARGTHMLSSAEGGTHQDSERKLASEGHSQAIEHRARDLSGAKEAGEGH
jgi:hypothetical protein